MRIRAAVELFVVVGAMAAVTFSTRTASADDDNGHRFGLVPSLGGGVGGVVNPGPLTGTIGFTDLGIEMLGEIRPWGLYLRGDFLSSGNNARWTAYSIGAGLQYRLFGTSNTTALFLRGGLVYERWLGNNQGCPITFFVPNSCNLLGANANSMVAPFSTTADMIGVTPGIRVEMPLSKFYVAFGATFVPAVSVDDKTPGGAFSLRFDLEAGFRDSRKQATSSRRGDPDEYRRRR